MRLQEVRLLLIAEPKPDCCGSCMADGRENTTGEMRAVTKITAGQRRTWLSG